MKNIIIMICLLAFGYFIYTKYINTGPEEVRKYKEIAEMWCRGEMGPIREMAADPMVENRFEHTSADVLLQPVGLGPIVKFEYEDLVVNTVREGVEWEISATQVLHFNPQGIKDDNFASWRAWFPQRMHLRKVADEWQILSFWVELKKKGEYKYKK